MLTVATTNGRHRPAINTYYADTQHPDQICWLAGLAGHAGHANACCSFAGKAQQAWIVR
jgi:hypothetical protein